MKRKDKPTRSLSSEQQAAVDAREGAFAVSATAGAGKTLVLVERYRKLRETTPVADILSLTFTAAAAKNMRDRAGETETADRPCGFATFHAFCLAVAVREHEHFRYALQPNPLAPPGVASKFIGEAARRYQADFRTLQTWVSRQKREGRDAQQAVLAAEDSGDDLLLALAYKEYEQKLREAGLLDFDALLSETVRMFAVRPEVRERYQSYFVQADEAQDTDALQLKLIQQISDKYKNVYLVGDSNQNIFSWRGSSSDILLNFQDYFPGGHTLYLSTNYRSTGALTAHNYAIAPYPPPTPYEAAHEQGEPPEVLRFANELSEAEGVALDIEDSIGSRSDLFGNSVRPEKPEYNHAVLARTNRALRAFEEQLSERDIPYHLLGRSGYWSQPEVRHVLAYVQFVSVPTDAAVRAALNAPFHPSKFIRKRDLLENLKRTQNRTPDATLYSLLSQHEDENAQQDRSIASFRSFLTGLRKYAFQPAGAAISGILTDLRALDYYATEEEAFDNDPIQNLRELARIAGRFQSVRDFLEYVRKIRGASKVRKGVAVGTIHSSKGLEFRTVYLVCCQEGILPHARSEDVEEEKRILFVGCSRAAKRLIISYSGVPSRFLNNHIYEHQDQTLRNVRGA